MASSDKVTWKQLKEYPLAEIIKKLERDVEIRDAEFRGVIKTIKAMDDTALGRTILTLAEGLGKVSSARTEDDIYIYCA